MRPKAGLQALASGSRPVLVTSEWMAREGGHQALGKEWGEGQMEEEGGGHEGEGSCPFYENTVCEKM